MSMSSATPSSLSTRLFPDVRSIIAMRQCESTPPKTLLPFFNFQSNMTTASLLPSGDQHAACTLLGMSSAMSCRSCVPSEFTMRSVKGRFVSGVRSTLVQSCMNLEDNACQLRQVTSGWFSKARRHFSTIVTIPVRCYGTHHENDQPASSITERAVLRNFWPSADG